MSSYGVGQGLAQGVQMLAPMVMNKMRMDQQDKQYYDALAVRQGWQDGVMGDAQAAAASPATIDQSSQVGRFSVPGRPLAMPLDQAGAGMTPGMALSQPQAPRMPVPGQGLNLRPARRLY